MFQVLPLASSFALPYAGAPLRCERRPAGAGQARLALIGELDLASVSLVEERLRAIPPDVRAIIIDLSDLEFMDSSGVHMLERAATRARARGVHLALLTPLPSVRRLLDLVSATGFSLIADVSAPGHLATPRAA